MRKKSIKLTAYSKDIRRNIRYGRKRFFSILIITLLGVMMFSGLQASCEDLRVSADAFYDAQKLHDLTVVSTLGLTEEDVDALLATEGVEAAEGLYSEDVSIDNGEQVMDITLQTISTQGIDELYLKEGRLPEKANEAVVTEKFTEETGLSVGDSFRIIRNEEKDPDDTADEEPDTEIDTSDLDIDTEEEDTESHILEDSFTITGLAIDPTNIDNPFGQVSYRKNAVDTITAYILPEAEDSDVFTSVVLRTDDTENLKCYTDDYETKVSGIRKRIENDVQPVREKARTEALKADAEEKLADGKKTADEKLADAYQQLSDGEQELNNELADAKKELEDGEKELADGKQQLTDGEKQLDDAQTELDNKRTSAEAELASGRNKLTEARGQLAQQITNLTNLKTAMTADPQAAAAVMQSMNAGENSAAMSADDLAANIAALEEQLQAIDAQLAALDDKEAELKNGIAEGQAEIDANRKTLEEKKQELSDGEKELTDGWEEYNKGKEDGEKELADGWKEYNEAVEEVKEKLADAEKKIEEIDDAQWYVQDRSSLSGYSNVKSDADSIDSIGTVFPVVFLAVAILMSLTTIARMVDEDRGLIGTYKSLGFTDREIRRKYFAYAGLACLAGSILGTILAFVIFPEFIFMIFEMMYVLPYYRLSVIWPFLIGGPFLFFGGILLATLLACRKELKETPATLMRPKTPKAGSRVFLERITPVWNHMNFLNKVTARNLFRYKGRMLMTIFGIGGCMALLLFGFAIKDSVADLCPRQYGETSKQDLLAVASSDDNDKLLSYIENQDREAVEDFIDVEISTVKLKYGDLEESVQLIVVPDGESFDDYVGFESVDGETLKLRDGAIYVTRNIGNVMGFRAGETIDMQIPDLEQASIPVTALVKNYLSNYVYMTQSTYENYYAAYEPNAVMLHFSDKCADLESRREYGENLKKQDGVLSVTVTSVLKDEFTEAFKLMNIIVMIVIVMSAALAFTVLFTLATTNISERERELATIKVLGFYDGEVHSYIHKETWFLTIIGVVIGIPLGWAFAQSLTIVLNLPGIYLAVSLHTVSYLISAGLTLFFALLVQFMTNRTLNEIDPVTALKSVE